MLQAPELSFDRGTAPIQVTPPVRLARDERVQARRLPPDGLRQTLTSRTAPLRGLSLEVSTRERPSTMLALRGNVVATLDGRRLAEREDRHRVMLGAGVLHQAVPA
jgi:hypothetical protein